MFFLHFIQQILKQKVDLSQYNTEQKSNFEKIIMIKHRHATKTI